MATDSGGVSQYATNLQYKKTFVFDEWNNSTIREGKVSLDEMESISAVNAINRRQDWQYDADCSLTFQFPLTTEYDAAGRQIETVDSTPRGHLFPASLIAAFQG